ncbi:hypothetical protein [Agrococcus sp. KRD186]|nr:hypothetical protein [Agrococcus sp. KRD186]
MTQVHVHNQPPWANTYSVDGTFGWPDMSGLREAMVCSNQARVPALPGD